MNTILIIGAGFSGTLIAARLLKLDTQKSLCVYLVNGSGLIARGMAYGTQSLHHVLNVPAGNMSAFDEDPQHFLRYAKRIDPSIEAGSFVPRRIYGDYLEWLLSEAERTARPNIELKRIYEQVTSIVEHDKKDTYSVSFENGNALIVKKIVLALGHFPSQLLPIQDKEFYKSARYLHDPWDSARLDSIPARSPVLLIGTGLTAIDVATSLLSRNQNRQITAVSRRGLAPQAHRVATGTLLDSGASSIWGDADTVRSQLRGFRKFCENIDGQRRDWRDGMAILRPVTSEIWLNYSDKERRRFIRHLQAFWDTHRHRLAPAVAERFSSALASGVIRTIAGRVASLEEHKDGVKIGIRPRGSEQLNLLEKKFVINCTGPCADPSQAKSVLVKQLLSDGYIRIDKLGLGIDVTPECATISAHGKISSNLFYIGPWLKATYWEATAVPDLRVMAKKMTNQLVLD